jgi:hypothetical protein
MPGGRPRSCCHSGAVWAASEVNLVHAEAAECAEEHRDCRLPLRHPVLDTGSAFSERATKSQAPYRVRGDGYKC